MVDRIVKEVQALGVALTKASSGGDVERTKDILGQLKAQPINMEVLKATAIGKVVGNVKKSPPSGDAAVAGIAKDLGEWRGGIRVPV